MKKKRIWRVYKVPARTKEKMHSRLFFQLAARSRSVSSWRVSVPSSVWQLGSPFTLPRHPRKLARLYARPTSAKKFSRTSTGLERGYFNTTMCVSGLRTREKLTRPRVPVAYNERITRGIFVTRGQSGERNALTPPITHTSNICTANKMFPTSSLLLSIDPDFLLQNSLKFIYERKRDENVQSERRSIGKIVKVGNRRKSVTPRIKTLISFRDKVMRTMINSTRGYLLRARERSWSRNI